MSVVVMAHPKRRRWFPYLTKKLDDPRFVIDEGWNNRHRTGRLALEAYDPAASHHLVVQDDTLICQDFLPAVEHIAALVGDTPVSFYAGRVRRNHPSWPVRQAVNKAAKNGTSWVAADGPRWGPAIMLPVPWLDDLTAWYRGKRIRNYDRRIFVYNRKRRQGVCWYTAPSLVDHRTVKEHRNVSLAARGRRGPNRRAERFIGEDVSALSIDWTRLP